MSPRTAPPRDAHGPTAATSRPDAAPTAAPAVACRRAAPGELPAVAAFVREVYAHDVAPAESAEGRATFARYADAEAMAARAASHVVWVAERAGAIVGVLEVRDGTHVALLFVAPAAQRRGVAGALLAAAFGARAGWPALTVNSTPGAVAAYARLGFEPVGPPVERDGLRFQPMRREGDAPPGLPAADRDRIPPQPGPPPAAGEAT